MKMLLTVAAAGLMLGLTACNSTSSTNTVAPGAVSSGCCQGERFGSEGCCKATICEENAAKKAECSEG